MKRKRTRKALPIMLLWSKAERRRFIDAVEKLQALCNDLETLLVKPKRRREAADAKQRLASANGGEV